MADELDENYELDKKFKVTESFDDDDDDEEMDDKPVAKSKFNQTKPPLPQVDATKNKKLKTKKKNIT